MLGRGSQVVPSDSYQPFKDATQGTIDETSQAITHALFAWSALTRGDVDGGKAHAHHVLNIIEGPQGPDYDASYGGLSQGIGDGVGALVHAQTLLDLLNRNPPENSGTNYQIAAENVVFFLQTAVTHVLNALSSMKNGQPTDTAIQELRQAQGLLMAARGSQEEKDRPTEGGARTIMAWLAGL
jgi:hypothetical protein